MSLVTTIRKYLSNLELVELTYMLGSRNRHLAKTKSDYAIVVLTRQALPDEQKAQMEQELSVLLNGHTVCFEPASFATLASLHHTYVVEVAGITLFEHDLDERVTSEYSAFKVYQDGLQRLDQLRERRLDATLPVSQPPRTPVMATPGVSTLPSLADQEEQEWSFSGSIRHRVAGV